MGLITKRLRWLVLSGAFLARGLDQIAPRMTNIGDTLPQNLMPRLPGNAQTQIRILTANLWHDFPLHRKLEDRWEAFATTLQQQQVDIACLQEVPSTSRISNRAIWLGEKLGAAYVYGCANGNEQTLGFEEGLAIISRYPLSSPQLFEIAPQPSAFEHRCQAEFKDVVDQVA